jgi:hypothetical protein
MKLQAILFKSETACLIKREGNISAPNTHVNREDLPNEQKTHWDTTVAALNGLLELNEKVISTEINPAAPFPITFEDIEEEFNGQTFTRQNPTAWRDTLNAYIQIKMANGGSRRLKLNTEEFSVTAARDSLLALWDYLDS